MTLQHSLFGQGMEKWPLAFFFWKIVNGKGIAAARSRAGYGNVSSREPRLYQGSYRLLLLAECDRSNRRSPCRTRIKEGD